MRPRPWLVLLAVLFIAGCVTTNRPRLNIVADFTSSTLTLAANKWNEVLGFEAFVFDGTGEEDVVITEVDSFDENGQIGEEFDNLFDNGCTIHVLHHVDFVNDRPAQLFAHELGHCLGLGHSPDPTSVMHTYPIGTVFTQDVIFELEQIYGPFPVLENVRF